MKKVFTFATASALALSIAAPAFAQGTLVGTTAMDNAITDKTNVINREIAKGEDALRFGPNGVAQGWRGSMALSSSATSGNTTTGAISLAGRMTYGVGSWNHSVGVSGDYGQTSGVATTQSVFATYEANRFFNDKFYAFGIGRVNYDKFATNKVDAFIGFGPGVRLINTDQVAWRVQAGPGVRYTESATNVKTTQASAIISSRFFYKLTGSVSLTNDTDFLASKGSTLGYNSFGVNFKVTDKLSTRVSYDTEFNSAPLAGFGKYDNKLAMSLVVGF